MPHVRTGIRNALVTQLTGLATTGARVYVSRTYPRADGSLPCLLVITNDEPEPVIADGSPQMLERSLDVQLRGVVKASTGLDDMLDKIIEEVEVAMGAITTLGGLIKNVSQGAIEVSFDDNSDKPVGLVDINYRFTYFTRAGSPATAL